MTWFIFFGDMLVMLFMAALAVWVLWRSSDETIQRTARIPLQDERLQSEPAPGEAVPRSGREGHRDQGQAGQDGPGHSPHPRSDAEGHRERGLRPHSSGPDETAPRSSKGGGASPSATTATDAAGASDG